MESRHKRPMSHWRYIFESCRIRTEAYFTLKYFVESCAMVYEDASRRSGCDRKLPVFGSRGQTGRGRLVLPPAVRFRTGLFHAAGL